MLKKRLIFAFLIVTIFCVGLGTKNVAAQNVNNFTVQNFTADYYISRSNQDRSQLRTVEKITAEFPQTDQNHGIERAIPEVYDGHTVGLHIVSVTDAMSRPVMYSTYESNDNLVVRIGSGSTYVHGQQTYILTYAQQDVTKNFGDHDEFYWDTNGTEWAEPFTALTAQVHVPNNLASAYQSKNACYIGSAGSTDKNCVVSTEPDGSGVVISFQAGRSLLAGESLTFVLGFKVGTFQPFQLSRHDQIVHNLYIAWMAVGWLLCVVALFISGRLWLKYGRAPKGRGTIIPEYAPQTQLTLLQAAYILGKTDKALTAQIIDLAIRGNLKIYDTIKKNFIGSKHVYELELVSTPKNVTAQEQQLLEAIFASSTEIGTRVSLDSLRTKLARTFEASRADTKRELVAQGYYADHIKLRRKCFIVSAALFLGGLLTLNFGISAAAIPLFFLALRLRPLSEKGVLAAEYLKGLKMYMDMAEADRIRYLQSPEGAEKLQIDPTNPAQLVKLYEKLLPYAILFGIEREWAKQFASLYQQPPTWYGGNWATFNAIIFVDALGGFTSTAATTFTPPSSSSSSGLSGGFSGGGGGGGGGGGW